MEKNKIISDEELKENGFSYLVTYHGEQIWAKKLTRIFRELGTSVINKIWENGKEKGDDD